MSHPLVIIHSKKWNEFIKHFTNVVARLLREQEGKLSDEDIEAQIKQYHSAIENNKQDIFLATAVSITQYCNYYIIRPTEGVHDEFKGIYFTGIAVSEALMRLGYVELNKLHQRAILGLLDYRLEHPHKARREDLSARIRTVIDNNNVESHFGKYGWYLLYKCLFNAANNNSKTL